jgi:hypothetical protein
VGCTGGEGLVPVDLVVLESDLELVFGLVVVETGLEGDIRVDDDDYNCLILAV